MPEEYFWTKLLVVTLVVVPSPKFQSRLVMTPTDASVKLTVSGAGPFVGVPVKLETGVHAPPPSVQGMGIWKVNIMPLERPPVLHSKWLKTLPVSFWMPTVALLPLPVTAP